MVKEERQKLQKARDRLAVATERLARHERQCALLQKRERFVSSPQPVGEFQPEDVTDRVLFDEIKRIMNETCCQTEGCKASLWQVSVYRCVVYCIVFVFALLCL